MIKNTIILLAFITATTSLVLSLYRPDKKFVFIEMGKIYDEFQLTTELNKDLEKAIKARKSITDSLFEELRAKTIKIKQGTGYQKAEVENLARMEQEYLYRKEQFEKENQAVTAEYSNKIWSRLNQYIQDYGELNNLKIIFGANGQGNIMYGEDSRNITGEITAYVNSRYNNKP